MNRRAGYAAALLAIATAVGLIVFVELQRAPKPAEGMMTEWGQVFANQGGD